MIYMLCRNRVRDLAHWRTVFSSHEPAHLNAGLRLLWLGVEGQDNVFFLFEVASLDRARKFIGDPGARKTADASGVIDGEYHFIEDAGGYMGNSGSTNPFGC